MSKTTTRNTGRTTQRTSTTQRTAAQKRRASAKKRQQQKLMITGGLLLVLIILIGAIALVSCGSDYADATTNTIYVLDNGKIVATDIEEFDKNTYSENELENYIKDTIKAYNKENGSGSVKQKSLKVKEGVGTLVLQYANAKAYSDFTGTELFVGTIEEALEAGYSFEGQFAKVSDGIVECTSEDFLSNDEVKVVIFRANTTVSVEGDILYLSADNISSYTGNTVTTKNNCSIFDLVAQQNTETESTETSGSVGEDELLVEETVIFDFGEEENTKQYSDVYTYIIFK